MDIMISIQNLFASIEGVSILNNLCLELKPGTTHAIMGPNGSGKSTLAQSIIGNPLYETSGSMKFDSIELTELSPHERAKRGIFLSFQQPPAIPGLQVFTLLKEMRQAQKGSIDLISFKREVEQYCDLLKMDQSFLERSCNEGFSGGERKRFELLQVLVAQPKLVILDEIDSGLDIDALKLVARVIDKLKAHNPSMIILLITHYKRILEHISPDEVHILVQGAIAESSDSSLIHLLEQKGYDGYLQG